MRWPPPPNPLTTVSVWIAAIFIAVKEGAGSVPATAFIADHMGGVWSHLPLGVLVLAAAIYLLRLIWPRRVPSVIEPAPEPASEAEIRRDERLREKEANRHARELAALSLVRSTVRKLTTEQHNIIFAGRAPTPVAKMTISYVDAGDCYEYALDFARAFELGWLVQPLEAIGPLDDPPHSGLLLPVQDRNHLTEQEDRISRALRAAGLAHEIRSIAPEDRRGEGLLFVTPLGA